MESFTGNRGKELNIKFRVTYYIDGVSDKAYYMIHLLDGLVSWDAFTVNKNDENVYAQIAKGFEDCLNELINN